MISLTTSFLQYIAYEINPDDDEEQFASPNKEQLDEEKQQLLSFKPVMQKFLHDHVNLQVGALYALQVHCNAKGFPKGVRSVAETGNHVTVGTLAHNTAVNFIEIQSNNWV